MDFADCSNLAAPYRSRPGLLVAAGRRFPARGQTLAAGDCGAVLAGEDRGSALTAKDQGRIVMACRTTYAGKWCLRRGERRFLRIDFAGLAELADDGEGLTGTPTVSLSEPTASGIDLSGVAIDGTRVGFWADTADASLSVDADRWEVAVEVQTTGGATLIRTGTIKVEA